METIVAERIMKEKSSSAVHFREKNPPRGFCDRKARSKARRRVPAIHGVGASFPKGKHALDEGDGGTPPSPPPLAHPLHPLPIRHSVSHPVRHEVYN